MFARAAAASVSWRERSMEWLMDCLRGARVSRVEEPIR